MCLCYLRRNVDIQPEALPTRTHLRFGSSSNRACLKQPQVWVHRRSRLTIQKSHFRSLHANRLIGRAVTDVSTTLDTDCAYSDPVAINRSIDRIFGFYLAAWRRQPKFVDDLGEHVSERLAIIPDLA